MRIAVKKGGEQAWRRACAPREIPMLINNSWVCVPPVGVSDLSLLFSDRAAYKRRGNANEELAKFRVVSTVEESAPVRSANSRRNNQYSEGVVMSNLRKQGKWQWSTEAVVWNDVYFLFVKFRNLAAWSIWEPEPENLEIRGTVCWYRNENSLDVRCLLVVSLNIRCSNSLRNDCTR